MSSVTQGSGGELAEHTTQYAPTPDAISPEVDPIMLLLGGVEGEAEGAAEEGASAVECVLGVGGGEASGVVEGGASTAAGVAPDPNKLIHIFGNPGHNLSALVQAYGSKEAAYDALVRATQEAVTTKGLTGIFKATVQVGADTITVEGRVIDGVARIGTAYKP